VLKMPTDTELKDFQELINDPIFPQSLLQGEGAIERLQYDCFNDPVQFARSVYTTAVKERFAPWYTPKGQEILSQCGLTVEDLMRNLK